jgi:hypothetical protein
MNYIEIHSRQSSNSAHLSQFDITEFPKLLENTFDSLSDWFSLLFFLKLSLFFFFHNIFFFHTYFLPIYIDIF